MAETRNIFTVHATIVNENGVYSKVSGFPKEFDSASYADETHPLPAGNPKKAWRRAKAAAHTQLGLNYAVDNRRMQSVYIIQADGREVFSESEGSFEPEQLDPEQQPLPDNPEPEEPAPEEPALNEGESGEGE